MQVWCGVNSNSGLFRSGGVDWAIAPVGTAATVSQTRWTPVAEALLVGPAARGATDARYGCTCFKDCVPSASGLVCTSGEARSAGEAGEAAGLRVSGISRGAEGRCACSCGGVAA